MIKLKAPGLGYFGCCLIIISCSFQKPEPQQIASTDLSPKYAQGFQVQVISGVKIITVTRPWAGASESFTYALIRPGDTPPDIKIDQVITIPVRKIVATSTTHIPAFDLLNASNQLVGFPQTQYISSPQVRTLVEQGSIQEIGGAQGLNLEALIALQPEIIMTYQSGPDRAALEALKVTEIPIVLNADFLEESPLGRAEWIKFTGHFLDRAEQADSVFEQIEKDYLQSRDKLLKVSHRPSVFSGSLYGGTWYAPGGASFIAQYIKDAGANYTWSSEEQVGSLELSFESVIQKNSTTDFWIGLGSFTSFKNLKAADARYENFKAFQNQQVFNYHRRIGATGGFEYLELGSARPDIVLKDFIKILHPDLLPDYQLYFFKKLD